MLLTVGRIIRPHGVRGEVVVQPHTDEPDLRYRAGAEFVPQPALPGGRLLRVRAFRPHQGRLIVTFDGVADRNAAEVLRGVLLQVDSADLPAPEDPDEFLDHQLIGLTVETVAGERVGELVRIDHAPAADLLVVARPDGRTTLVPFVAAIVPKVDLAGGRVILDPPGGLLDL